VLGYPALIFGGKKKMRIFNEITKLPAMESFLARPRFVLGAMIFLAGTTLLLTEALKVIYK
jgi:hypothetical protein